MTTQPPPSRPKLPTSLDSAPPLVRSPYSMTHFLSIALNQPGPSFSDKGKAKEILRATPPPAWYPASVTSDDEDVKLEGSWWSFIGKDETYTAGLPSVPMMAHVTPPRKRRMPGRKIRRSSVPNGDSGIHKTPPLVLPGPVSMEKVVYRSVDKLCEARRVVGQIQEFQRIETEGGILPTPNQDEEEERKEREKKERISKKRRRKAELVEATKRRRTGGEIGEAEAVMGVKKTTASILAHAGFEGELRSGYHRGGMLISMSRCE